MFCTICHRRTINRTDYRVFVAWGRIRWLDKATLNNCLSNCQLRLLHVLLALSNQAQFVCWYLFNWFFSWTSVTCKVYFYWSALNWRSSQLEQCTVVYLIALCFVTWFIVSFLFCNTTNSNEHSFLIIISQSRCAAFLLPILASVCSVSKNRWLIAHFQKCWFRT